MYYLVSMLTPIPSKHTPPRLLEPEKMNLLKHFYQAKEKKEMFAVFLHVLWFYHRFCVFVSGELSSSSSSLSSHNLQSLLFFFTIVTDELTAQPLGCSRG